MNYFLNPILDTEKHDKTVYDSGSVVNTSDF